MEVSPDARQTVFATGECLDYVQAGPRMSRRRGIIQHESNFNPAVRHSGLRRVG
jgi:hypothetical protein